MIEYWNTAESYVRTHDAQVMIGMAAVILLLLILVVSLSRRIRKLGRMNLGAVDGETSHLLRDELKDHAKNLAAISNRLDNLQQHQTDLTAKQELCLQKMGFVRFDAFDDVGGEQSFALALLDAKSNGVVISNLFSRVDSRVYAKRVSEGRSETTLSGEEKSAVEKAATP